LKIADMATILSLFWKKPLSMRAKQADGFNAIGP
jgi:hypothetical protein